ncbi:hypothetical protein Bca52824_058237 [Brassica carinata]|uniref:Uncharacterized protein n=1 Tax=Brassica carinata TaxID=52824 RepID=A0A8X7QTK0_BRACI|nr:hypothetical protein Bca52824_058237 [Brassica carinata]
MGDRDQEKNMENPDTVQKVRGGLGLHQTERTVLVIAPRLCPRDTSLDLSVHNRTASLDTVYDLLSQDRYTVCLSQGKSRKELRMVLVKLRSCESSVSERLCNVWLDDARDELVIVYETVKKLCIGSHVSK